MADDWIIRVDTASQLLFSAVYEYVYRGGEAENIQPLSIGQLAIDRETK